MPSSSTWAQKPFELVNYQNLTLRSKFPNMEFFLVRMQSEYRKTRTKKKETAYLDTFYAVLNYFKRKTKSPPKSLKMGIACSRAPIFYNGGRAANYYKSVIACINPLILTCNIGNSWCRKYIKQCFLQILLIHQKRLFNITGDHNI